MSQSNQNLILVNFISHFLRCEAGVDLGTPGAPAPLRNLPQGCRQGVNTGPGDRDGLDTFIPASSCGPVASRLEWNWDRSTALPGSTLPGSHLDYFYVDFRKPSKSYRLLPSRNYCVFFFFRLLAFLLTKLNGDDLIWTLCWIDLPTLWYLMSSNRTSFLVPGNCWRRISSKSTFFPTERNKQPNR